MERTRFIEIEDPAAFPNDFSVEVVQGFGSSDLQFSDLVYVCDDNEGHFPKILSAERYWEEGSSEKTVFYVAIIAERISVINGVGILKPRSAIYTIASGFGGTVRHIFVRP